MVNCLGVLFIYFATNHREDTGKARNLEMPMDTKSPKKSLFSPAKEPEKTQPSKKNLLNNNCSIPAKHYRKNHGPTSTSKG